jgi:excisionase family DNA binding protein
LALAVLHSSEKEVALFIDKKRAAEIVSLSPKTIERLIHRGELRASRLAGKIRIRCEDLYTWVEANAIEPSPHDI